MTCQETKLRYSMKETSEREAEKLKELSLKDVPLKERRKEADKPLFLVRYE